MTACEQRAREWLIDFLAPDGLVPSELIIKQLAAEFDDLRIKVLLEAADRCLGPDRQRVLALIEQTEADTRRPLAPSPPEEFTRCPACGETFDCTGKSNAESDAWYEAHSGSCRKAAENRKQPGKWGVAPNGKPVGPFRPIGRSR